MHDENDDSLVAELVAEGKGALFPIHNIKRQAKFINSHESITTGFKAFFEEVFESIAFNGDDPAHLLCFIGFIGGYCCRRDRTFFDSQMLALDDRLGIDLDSEESHVNCMKERFALERQEFDMMIAKAAMHIIKEFDTSFFNNVKGSGNEPPKTNH